MARLPRYCLPDYPQHVIQRGNNRGPIFVTAEDYVCYRDCLADATSRYPADVHAYVFMTNHVHLLMTPRRPDSLARVLQSVGRRYVRYFNDTYQRTGTLWEGRYRATVIDSELYFLCCCRYIELNPVRAGMAAHRAAVWRIICSKTPWCHCVNVVTTEMRTEFCRIAGSEQDLFKFPRLPWALLLTDE